MHSQMRIELAGHTFELETRRCKHSACLPAGFNKDAGKVCKGSIGDLAQAATGA
jgi:hypothetical protein